MLEAAMPFSPPNVLIIEIQPEPASPTEKPAPPAKERPKKKRKREPTPLTAKQRMALELWAENRTNISKVAKAMGIDRKTAKQHLSCAFKKLGAAETRIFKEHMRKREQYRDLPHDKRGQVMLEGERVWPKPEVLVEDSDATGADEENSDEGKNEPQPGDEDFDENFDDEEDDSEDEE
jgi:DNA-binding CsgD family transcriptional regulator